MNSESIISKDSVILVTGGAKGITADCVIKLAQHTSANFILLGRSSITEELPFPIQMGLSDAEMKQQVIRHLANQGEKPTPQSVSRLVKKIRSKQDIEKTLSDVRKTGSNVEYVDVDVSDASSMKMKLAEPIKKFGKVTGVIHGAGSLADKLIEKKSEQDYQNVVSPKVDGLINLLDVAPVKNLKFLVLFSSIVGVFGNIGQTDYAIANEVLNKAAYQAKRENPDCRVISINWGPWDSGMVTPELKKAFAERNMDVIPTEAGADQLVKELTSEIENNQVPVQIVIGAIPTRPAVFQNSELKHYEVRRKLKLEENPFLLDHKIGINPVLPATCAASWIASVSEQLYPGYSFFKLEDFKVLKGIVFDGTLADEHILDLVEVEKVPDEKVKFSAKIFSMNKSGKPIFHYSQSVTLLRIIPISPVVPVEISKKKNFRPQIKGADLYNDGTLFHGPAFQGVRQVLDISEEQVILECILPGITPEDQGQFPLQTTNPYIFDAIVQSLLIWSQQYYQAPCLPSQLVRLEQFRAIPFGCTCYVDMQIVSHSETSVVADITVFDQMGNVFVKFIQLQGTISPLLKRFIGAKSEIMPGATNV